MQLLKIVSSLYAARLERGGISRINQGNERLWLAGRRGDPEQNL
jgi:hypothetical protein